LIHVRNDTPALRRGTHDPLASSSALVLAYLRQEGQQTVLCLANTSDTAESGVTVSGTAVTLPPGEYTVRDLLNPMGTQVLTVTPAFEITGFDLAGHEVRAYEVLAVSAVDPGSDTLPRTGLRLEQNHPNPFNPSTTIGYTLPARSHVRIGVFDVAGREVVVLEDRLQDEGRQEVRWNGLDRTGQAVGAGVYFVRLDSGQETRLTKMTLVK